jgi:hypothetical protein
VKRLERRWSSLGDDGMVRGMSGAKTLEMNINKEDD